MKLSSDYRYMREKKAGKSGQKIKKKARKKISFFLENYFYSHVKNNVSENPDEKFQFSWENAYWNHPSIIEK